MASVVMMMTTMMIRIFLALAAVADLHAAAGPALQSTVAAEPGAMVAQVLQLVDVDHAIAVSDCD